MLLKGNRSCKMKKNEKIDLVYKLCRYVVDTLFWGCMVMALFVVMQIFLFSSFKIPSNSMEPGLIAGDYVLVNKLIPGARLFNVFASLRGEQVQIVRLPGLREIRRNDVVVFNYPYPNNLDRIEMHMMKYYIKRCLGLPGDSLSIVNGYYRVNGIFEPVGNIEGQELFSVQSNKMLKDAGFGFLVAQKVTQFDADLTAKLLDRQLYTPLDADNPEQGGYQVIKDWKKGKGKGKIFMMLNRS